LMALVIVGLEIFIFRKRVCWVSRSQVLKET